MAVGVSLNPVTLARYRSFPLAPKTVIYTVVVSSQFKCCLLDAPPPSTRHSNSPATFWQPKTTEWDDYVEQWKDLPVAAQYKATIAVYADACQVRTAC